MSCSFLMCRCWNRVKFPLFQVLQLVVPTNDHDRSTQLNVTRTSTLSTHTEMNRGGGGFEVFH
jgi:hypothetical protein